MQVLNGHVQMCSVNGTLPETQYTVCPIDLACAALPQWVLDSTLGLDPDYGADTFIGNCPPPASTASTCLVVREGIMYVLVCTMCELRLKSSTE